MKQIVLVAGLIASSMLAKAQSLSHAIVELQNENYIKAKMELLALPAAELSSEAYLYLGNAYYKLGSVDTATQYYKKAELNSDAMGMIAKARLAVLNNKDTNEIKTYIEKAIAYSKHKNPEIIFQAACLAYQPKLTQLSFYMPYAIDAHKMASGNDYYTLTLGDMFLELGDGGKAMSLYEDVAAKNPNNVLANIRIGRLYYASMNYEEAIAYLEKANGIDPGFSIAHKELGELYFLTKQFDKAQDEFKKYIELNGNDSRAKSTYSAFLYQLKEYQKAVDEVKVYQLTDPNNFIYNRVMAYCQFELKKYKEANDAMKQFWNTVGTNKVTALDYSYAGRIAASIGDTSTALSCLKSSVQVDSLNADMVSEYARTLFNFKRYKESVAEYQKRMRMKKMPMSLDHYYLGRAYYATANYVMADSAFADFSRMQPKSPDGYLWRAKSKLELEDKKSLKGLSVAHYTKYVELIEADATTNGQQVLVKHKTNLINAYSYLAFVALTNKENATAKEQFRKILLIEPDNKIAKEEMSKL